MINLKQNEIVDDHESITQEIRFYRESIRRLLDVATGIKILSTKKPYTRTQEDDWRLVNTLKQLHVKTRELQCRLGGKKKP